jgi:hypothetical protein
LVPGGGGGKIAIVFDQVNQNGTSWIQDG